MEDLSLTVRRKRPPCPFYGFNQVYEALIDSKGNQCGLIENSCTPCQMEIGGYEPDWHKCPLNVKENDGILVRILDIKVFPNEIKQKHPWSGVLFRDWMKHVMK